MKSCRLGCQDQIILTFYVVLPLLEAEIVQLLMFDSSNHVSYMLAEYCQKKVLLTLILMLEEAVILQECNKDLADIELALDDSSVALEKLLDGFFLASDRRKVQ